MNIIVAGAGAGKTTSMAEKVLEREKKSLNQKIIYVITYTNSAKDCIRKKITEINGSIPQRIKVETIHTFLWQEVISPFHHLLYEKHYNSISTIQLPDKPAFKNTKQRELEDNNIIHVEKMTQVSKWILHSKSTDKKEEKNKRKNIFIIIKKYLDCIFLDEAQDMDEHISKIVEALYNEEIDLYLVGDPKQDLRGKNELRRIMDLYPHCIEYRNQNYRCPTSHVKLSNLYIPDKEKQKFSSKNEGQVKYLYESDIDPIEYLKEKTFDKIFISKKNDRYMTNLKDFEVANNTLTYELKVLLKRIMPDKEKINIGAYILMKTILRNIDIKSNWEIINALENKLSTNFTKQDKAKLQETLTLNRKNQNLKGILVSSIHKVKGLEGNNCLFILTTDLSEYMFMKKTEVNRTNNCLYVALTRSMKNLTIMVTHEAEERYGRDFIDSKFEKISNLADINIEKIT